MFLTRASSGDSLGPALLATPILSAPLSNTEFSIGSDEIPFCEFFCFRENSNGLGDLPGCLSSGLSSPLSSTIFSVGADEKPVCETLRLLHESADDQASAKNREERSDEPLTGLLFKRKARWQQNFTGQFFWQPRFFEVGKENICYWGNDHSISQPNITPPRGIFPLAAVNKVSLQDTEIIIHFAAVQRTGLHRRPRSRLCLRAATDDEALRWHEGILKTVAKVRTDLPINWDVEQMLNRDMRASELVAKVPLPNSKPILQKLLDHTFSCKATRDRHGVQAPLRLEVVEVIGIQNAHAWTEYQETRARTNATPTNPLNPDVLTNTFPDASLKELLGELDGPSQERFLFHGSTTDAIDCITDAHFNIALAGTHRGTMYGKGIYYAESSSKADEYAEESPDSGLCQMLLCRVALGRIMYDRSKTPSADLADRCKAGYDSLCADRLAAVGTFREFVVYEKKRTYPAYIISYRRAWQSDLSEAVRKATSADGNGGDGGDAFHQLIQHTSVLAATYPEEKVRLAMAVMLDVHAARAVPILVSCLDDSRDFVQAAAGTALRQFSERTGSVSLVQLDGSAKVTVKRLAKCLASPHVDAKVAAARALGQLGRDAAVALPSLAAALEDANENVRAAAAIALGLLRINVENFVPALTKLIKDDPHEKVRKDAAWALGRFGAASAPAVDVMIACLDESSGFESIMVRRGLIKALGMLGVHAASSVEVLRAQLEDTDVVILKEALIALGRLGPYAKPALQQIKSRCSDENEDVRKAAIASLRQIEHASQADFLRDTDAGDAAELTHAHCSKCGWAVAAKKGTEDSSWQKNPSGVAFYVGHFDTADGAQVSGPASSEASWFDGWQWRLAVCSKCSVHVGWRFEKPGAESFWTLIWERLTNADAVRPTRRLSGSKATRTGSKESARSGIKDARSGETMCENKEMGKRMMIPSLNVRIATNASTDTKHGVPLEDAANFVTDHKILSSWRPGLTKAPAGPIEAECVSGKPIQLLSNPCVRGRVHNDRNFKFSSIGGFAEKRGMKYLLTASEDMLTPSSEVMWRIRTRVPITVYLNFRTEIHVSCTGAKQWLEDQGWNRCNMASTVNTGMPDASPSSGPIFSKAIDSGTLNLMGSNCSEGTYLVFIEQANMPPVKRQTPSGKLSFESSSVREL